MDIAVGVPDGDDHDPQAIQECLHAWVKVVLLRELGRDIGCRHRRDPLARVHCAEDEYRGSIRYGVLRRVWAGDRNGEHVPTFPALPDGVDLGEVWSNGLDVLEIAGDLVERAVGREPVGIVGLPPALETVGFGVCLRLAHGLDLLLFVEHHSVQVFDQHIMRHADPGQFIEAFAVDLDLQHSDTDAFGPYITGDRQSRIELCL